MHQHSYNIIQPLGVYQVQCEIGTCMLVYETLIYIHDFFRVYNHPYILVSVHLKFT